MDQTDTEISEDQLEMRFDVASRRFPFQRTLCAGLIIP